MENLQFGYSATPFGQCCIVFDDEQVYALAFVDSADDFDITKLVAAKYTLNNERCDALATDIFINKKDVKIIAKGTDFQVTVWNELRKIPFGETRTYSQIAQQIGRPSAVRAVANAVGANKISYIIPCHRVIRSDGGIGGFRWGVEVKRKLLADENNGKW
ncbi:MAG: methylated-DNA--[protein]-cysteine S-methyltransferase [Paludibacter sp.]|jgi:O-6-methylguanine DNA methyltransferase|nr:methylated-DNA--[protein]-cysteine S-methyltransferase [Paludibacter sp.]